MKRLALLFLFLLTACGATPFDGGLDASPGGAYSTIEAFQLIATAMPTETATPIPTATIGYQATAAALAIAATENRYQELAVTSEAERRAQEQLIMTADAERRAYEQAAWTATAALTAIPLTSTAQGEISTAIAVQQSIMSTGQVMTQQAPTMIVAMAQSQAAAAWAPIEAWIWIFVMSCIGVFMLALSVYALRATPPRRKEEPVEMLPRIKVPIDTLQTDADASPPIIIPTDHIEMTIKQDNGGYTSASMVKVPCTPEMLSEFAEGLVSGEKKLAFKYWEGRNSKHWTRELYLPMRAWLQQQQYVLSAGEGSGSLVLTDLGWAFLRGWLERAALPQNHEFEPMSTEVMGKSAHEREDHDHETAVGEPLSGQLTAVSN